MKTIAIILSAVVLCVGLAHADLYTCTYQKASHDNSWHATESMWCQYRTAPSCVATIDLYNCDATYTWYPTHKCVMSILDGDYTVDGWAPDYQSDSCLWGG